MKIITLALILFSSQVSAWYGPGPGFGWGPGWGYGMPYGYNYIPFIPGPSFNYQQTVIVQEPPQPAQVIIREPPPRVIVEEREIIKENPRTVEENERLRRYFGKY